MSFETNPADDENYERDLMINEIKELQQQLSTLREQLSEADWIIGSINKQAGNHADARHSLTPALRDSIHRYILKWHSTGDSDT